MREYKTLLVERKGGVLTITLNRPKVNAFNQQMVEELLEAIQWAKREAGIRCLVLTGAGRFFSTGHDVSEIAEERGKGSYRYHLERTYNRVVRWMRRLEKPIIGALNGPVVGAGLGIALATDLRWASENASFVFGFTDVGLTTDSGISLTLPLMIGLTRAMEMAFTNQPVSAQQALNYGLINRIVPDEELGSAVAALAATLAEGPTCSLGLTKRAFNRAMLSTLDAALDYEAYLQEIAGRTLDHEEGIAAFLEKRPPKFSGA